MKGDAVEEEGPFMLHRVAELCGGGMGEELWETGSKQLFAASSHHPVHRLDLYSPANRVRASRDLKPILAHNQHPADAVAVEHSSHTVDMG